MGFRPSPYSLEKSPSVSTGWACAQTNAWTAPASSIYHRCHGANFSIPHSRPSYGPPITLGPSKKMCFNFFYDLKKNKCHHSELVRMTPACLPFIFTRAVIKYFYYAGGAVSQPHQSLTFSEWSMITPPGGATAHVGETPCVSPGAAALGWGG